MQLLHTQVDMLRFLGRWKRKIFANSRQQNNLFDKIIQNFIFM